MNQEFIPVSIISLRPTGKPKANSCIDEDKTR